MEVAILVVAGATFVATCFGIWFNNFKADKRDKVQSARHEEQLASDRANQREVFRVEAQREAELVEAFVEGGVREDRTELRIEGYVAPKQRITDVRFTFTFQFSWTDYGGADGDREHVLEKTSVEPWPSAPRAIGTVEGRRHSLIDDPIWRWDVTWKDRFGFTWLRLGQGEGQQTILLDEPNDREELPRE